MAAYKLLGKHTLAGITDQDINHILRTSDGAWIPIDTDNRDYREYQEWLAAGNTPDPAS